MAAHTSNMVCALSVEPAFRGKIGIAVGGTVEWVEILGKLIVVHPQRLHIFVAGKEMKRGGQSVVIMVFIHIVDSGVVHITAMPPSGRRHSAEVPANPL